MASLTSRAVVNSSPSSAGSLTELSTATSSISKPLSSRALARISRTRPASLVAAARKASSIAGPLMNVPLSTTPLSCATPLFSSRQPRTVWRRRYLKTEFRPLAVLGVGADASLVQLDDAPGVVEAHARAAACLEGRVVQAREAPEELVLLGLAEARPQVPHRDLELGRAVLSCRRDFSLQPDGPILVAVLHGVVEKVDEDDTQQRGVAADLRQGRVRQLGHELHPVGLDMGGHQHQRLADDLVVHVHSRAQVGLQLPTFHAGEVEVLVHESEKVPALAGHAFQLGELYLREVAEVAMGHELGVGDHRRHGALELVAHEREHLRVRVVDLLELLDAPRLFHSLAEPFADGHLQLDVPRPVRVRGPRAAEDEADHAALHAQRAGEVGAHALLYEPSGRAAARARLEVELEVADDARLSRGQHFAERCLLQRLRIVLVDGEVPVVGAVVVAGDALAALVHEGQADAVAGDELSLIHISEPTRL